MTVTAWNWEAELATWQAMTADEIMDALSEIKVESWPSSSGEYMLVTASVPGYDLWVDLSEIFEAAGVIESHAASVTRQAEPILARLGAWLAGDYPASFGKTEDGKWINNVEFSVPPKEAKCFEAKVRKELARILATT